LCSICRHETNKDPSDIPKNFTVQSLIDNLQRTEQPSSASVTVVQPHYPTAHPSTSTENSHKFYNNPILDLEIRVLWSSVDNNWRNIRSDWIKATNLASTVHTYAVLVCEFEKHVLWQAVVDEWKVRRAQWVTDILEATTEQQLSTLIIELESAIRWEAVTDAWKTIRQQWSSTCQENLSKLLSKNRIF